MVRLPRALTGYLFPERCPRCDATSAAGFCRECRQDLPKIAFPCLRCALPRPCNPCPGDTSGWHLDAVHAPYVYCAPLAAFVIALKYGGQRRLGRVLGHLLAAELAEKGLALDATVSVPLHAHRLRARTFNQADEIARVVARRFRWPMLSGIRRTIDTRPQAELDGTERRRFSRDSFSVTRRLDGMRIAIVDDVITSGATVNALAARLKSAGAAEARALAVARSVGSEAQSNRPTRKT